MYLEYIYCNRCGHEDFEVMVAYVRTTASGDVYECPYCSGEVTCYIKECTDEH